MKSIEVSGKSIDQAIEIGLFKLGANKEDVKIDIIEEGSLFNKARVKLSINSESPEESKIYNMVHEFLAKTGLECDAQVEQVDEGYKINLFGKDVNLVIGRRGDCLDAIQYLLSLIINKNEIEYKKILVDSEGYRFKREETLKLLALRLANKAIREGRPVKLEPMSAFERRIIHTKLQDNTDVVTGSQGVEPARFVIITPKNTKDKRKQEISSNENRAYND